MSRVGARRAAIRLGLLTLFVGFGFLLAATGRGRTIILDNRTVTVAGVEYPSVPTVRVQVEGAITVELARMERRKALVAGSRHRLRIEAMAATKPIEKTVELGDADAYIISIPMILGGAESGWIAEF